MLVAAHRLDAGRAKEAVINMWVAKHANHRGLDRYLSDSRFGGAEKREEPNADESKEAAIGLMRVLGMGAG